MERGGGSASAPGLPPCHWRAWPLLLPPPEPRPRSPPPAPTTGRRARRWPRAGAAAPRRRPGKARAAVFPGHPPWTPPARAPVQSRSPLRKEASPVGPPPASRADAPSSLLPRPRLSVPFPVPSRPSASLPTPRPGEALPFGRSDLTAELGSRALQAPAPPAALAGPGPQPVPSRRDPSPFLPAQGRRAPRLAFCVLFTGLPVFSLHNVSCSARRKPCPSLAPLLPAGLTPSPDLHP